MWYNVAWMILDMFVVDSLMMNASRRVAAGAGVGVSLSEKDQKHPPLNAIEPWE